ncbi:DNA polymerase IV [Proteinivorax hydrogeniformans]|uniref:DNA polymerase IV n=1 Tax=Proteinivorax hydrogeniformans TaxID=1826727 RepID=A0AAU8HSH5_9FIRM
MECPIIHMDMDSFFAAVEKRDRPQLKDKPVIMANDPKENPRAVVSTACYVARKFGVKSAMSAAHAQRLCPDGIFIAPNKNKYAKESKIIMEILHSFTPAVEPLSIDEAFLDVKGCEKLWGSSREIAKKIQQKILKETGLTCSLGIAPNKYLAKLCSDYKKPNGITYLPPDKVNQFLLPLEVGKIWGVGGKLKAELNKLGIYTVADLQKCSQSFLTKRFNKMGTQLWSLARGIDNRPVQSVQKAQSISREYTFKEDIRDKNYLGGVVYSISDEISRKLRAEDIKAKTVYIKVKFSCHKTITRQISIISGTMLSSEISQKAVKLLEDVFKFEKQPIRLLGVGVANLTSQESKQLSFFDDADITGEKEEKLLASLDEVLKKYGESSVFRASTPNVIMEEKLRGKTTRKANNKRVKK